ncbi:AfsR/SARP family transcriptional regulator [Myceligenerans pegani]|uniref:Tetratricopeptide repeat protein n=1 Tax=Myceligenerans pegani TaxID=2776917 RepID=A0ABR9N0B0_9MICO|nr:BTAD domain-containing putative transcriptional regulator [Myceligenerans sp. TRM 65318]MBE1876716.1 tetratricopeptide repeat protein [Myceligenerans sp. TRM 65318]MBE3018987.1 tetratricopeptide repeat protein [Myceligenerans sp. TRM 65318]
MLTMRVRILGSPELSDGESWHPVTGKSRSVLGSLVARAPHPATVGEIIDDVWSQRAPDSAPTQVYGYVSKLRRLLGGTGPDAIRRRGPGYLLAAGDVGVDALRFEAEVRSGLDTFRAGRTSEARELLTAALALWRGEPFDGAAPGAAARALTARLENLRMTAVEHLLQVRIEHGEHEAVVDELQDQARRHPFREHLRRQLLIALYRSGREAEALLEYDRLRRTLADELGTDPSQATRDVYQQILDRNLPRPRTTPEGPDSASPPAPVPVPVSPVRQLPPGVPDFAGRAVELATLVSFVREHDCADAPAVVVVSGAPGTGKSTLVLRLARLIADRYPDAQLHLDLGGTSPAQREPGELLATLLHGLGRFGHPLPESVEARAALFRSMISGRRALLVLDDAAHAGQVRALLPPNGESAVVVTSRNSLTDLPGARHLQLGALEPEDAETLLARIVGPARVRREPAEARAIVRLCGYLPLSVRIAGGKLLSRPSWPLRQMLARLTDESRRLAELSLGDLDVRASVDLSIRSLPPDAALAFDLLGLLGPNDQPGWVLGALLDTEDHEPVMDLLLDAGLVQLVRHDAVGQARYGMHDLIRVHARERAVRRGAAVCRQAADRVVRGWQRLADRARTGRPPSLFDPLVDPGAEAYVDVPGGGPAGSADVVGAVVEPVEPTVRDAPAWLAAERHALLDAVRLARTWELVRSGAWLVESLAPLYDQKALYDDWRTGARLMLGLPGLDPMAEGALLRGLGQVMIYANEFDDATARLRASLRVYESQGHRIGVAMSLAGLATVHRFRGRFAEAEECLLRALGPVAAAGDAPREALLRGSIGRVLVARDRPDEARPWYDEALRLARGSGDRHREAVTLSDLGLLDHELGRPGSATARLERAVALFRGLDDERCTAMTLLRWAPVLLDGAETGRAHAALTEAAGIFHRIGLWDGEARCHALLGTLGTGRVRDAKAVT